MNIDDLSQPALTTELIDIDQLIQLQPDSKLFFVMDDIANNRILFSERPPGSSYWWYSVANGWELIEQTEIYTVSDQYSQINNRSNLSLDQRII